MICRPRLTELLNLHGSIAGALKLLNEGKIHRVESSGAWHAWSSDTSAVASALCSAQEEVELQIARLTARSKP